MPCSCLRALSQSTCFYFRGRCSLEWVAAWIHAMTAGHAAVGGIRNLALSDLQYLHVKVKQSPRAKRCALSAPAAVPSSATIAKPNQHPEGGKPSNSNAGEEGC